MKALEQQLVAARARVRGLRARVPFGPVGAPARIDVRLDDLDAPPGAAPPEGRPLDTDQRFDAIVDVVTWTGALPARVIARPTHPALPEIVRFLHRLECPVTLRTCARGLDARRADELVDAGVSRVFVRVAGGADDAGGVAETPDEPRAAWTALIGARRSRGARLDVLAEVVVRADAPDGVRRAFAAAREVGADGATLAPPWVGSQITAVNRPDLAWAATQRAPFHRTPGPVMRALLALAASPEKGPLPGRRRDAGLRRCAVAGSRIEVGPTGLASACPFKPGACATSALADGAGLVGHAAAVRACDRECWHPDVR